MPRCLIAGNWKMNGSLKDSQALALAIAKGAQILPKVEVVIIPPFPYLAPLKSSLVDSHVKLGAQNLYLGEKGAFTGEVSGPMLKDVGCHYVLVGHSERRTLFKEDHVLVAEKCKAALEVELIPILCVGESAYERENNQTQTVIASQLEAVIKRVGIKHFNHIVIAYEPIWAIGTGINATQEQADAVHAFIRRYLMQNGVDLAATMRILYGGSMKAENAASLLSMPNVNGGLIGAASLQAESFLKICATAEEAITP